MKFKRATTALAILLLVIAPPFAGAAVTPGEAAKLQSELTPLGAEKAGNKDGMIPVWNGGYTTVWPGYRSGQPRSDPFASERPRLPITAQNMQQYADQLSDGVKALLQRYPTYRLQGQRQVQRAPNVEYDTPSFLTSGFSLIDEGLLFVGNLDRYDWKLVGKKEMFVPYNTQRFHLTKVDQALGPQHLNPDYMRWELHRVWVVEATLAPGKRHVIPKRRFYLDEDTWQALLSDGWDANGQLWHVGQAMPVLVPEQPGVVVLAHIIYDLLKDGYAASNLLNEQRRQYQTVIRWPEVFFPGRARGRRGSVIKRFFFCRTGVRTVSPTLLGSRIKSDASHEPVELW